MQSATSAEIRNRTKHARLRTCSLGLLCAALVAGSSAGQAYGQTEKTAVSRPASFAESHPINARFGPLHLRGQSPFQMLRLSMIPVGADRIERARWLLTGTATWTNRWAWKKNKYLIDGEIWRLTVSATYGVTDWMQLRLEIPFCIRGGGILDGLIMGLHDTFGLGQMGRDHFYKNQFHIVFHRKDGTIFDMDSSNSSAAGIEDIVLTSTFRLTQGTKWIPQTCLTAHLKFPTGDEEELFGSGSLDGGLALCLAKRIWKLYAYLGVQYTRFGGDELAGIPMRQDQVSALSALEYPLNNRYSLLLQYLFNTGAASDFYEFSETTHEITVGFKGEIFRNTVFEFGMIENMFHFDNSPDFGFHFGLSRKL